MPHLVSSRLAEQLTRRTVTYSYTDEGYYLTAANPDITDAYGQPTASAEETLVECSFTDKVNEERWRGDADIETIIAEVRWSTPAPEKGGSFRITRRFGLSVTEKTYEIVGIKDRGAFGYVCALKAVTI